MPLTDHLEQLRNMLLRCAVVLGVGVIMAYSLSDSIVLFLEQPLLKALPIASRNLYFTGIAEKFFIYFQVSLMTGVVLASPYLLWEAWAFVLPALKEEERRFAAPLLFSGICAFLIGVLFAFYIVIPGAYSFLIQFGNDSDRALITLNEYFSFTLKLLVGIGLTFELPVVLLLLIRLGVVDVSLLVKQRRIAIVLSAVTAAVITPTPDAFTMLVVMLPLYALYELSIWIGYLIRPTRKP